MTDSLFGKLYGDKGYISKALAGTMFDKGFGLITNVRKNMKARLLSFWNRAIPAMPKWEVIMCLFLRRAIYQGPIDYINPANLNKIGYFFIGLSCFI